jgi:putative FmdB family regulatory protein
MPTYEYQCKSCDHRFEIWQKMSDEPLTVCPECKGTIRRILFPAGIVFKGSGFYKTDHGSGAVIGDNHQNGHKDKEGAGKTESTASESKTGGENTKEKVSSATTSESKTSAAAD